MTDRYKGLVVILEQDMRSDDTEASVIQAIRALRFVHDVQPIMADHGDWIIEQRVRDEIYHRVLYALRSPSTTPIQDYVRDAIRQVAEGMDSQIQA